MCVCVCVCVRARACACITSVMLFPEVLPGFFKRSHLSRQYESVACFSFTLFSLKKILHEVFAKQKQKKESSNLYLCFVD